MFDHPLALELAYIAVEESIRLGATYADARYELRHEENILTRNGGLVDATTGFQRGLGVRVLVRGSWGHVGVSEPNRHDVTVAAKQAVAAARAASILQDQPVELARQTPQRSLYRTSIRRDPLAVPLEDKLELLMGIDAELRGVEGIILAEGRFSALRQRKILVSSEGCEVDQELVTTAIGYRAGATDGKDLQIRSFPGGRDGMVQSQGWELVSDLPLLESAKGVAEEAVALSKADPCPNDTTTVILTGSQLAHHLLGTTAQLFELDRVVGIEKGDTGGSFLGADKLGSFEFGGPHLDIACDATLDGGAGTFGFDDEGVEGQRIELVSEGRLTGFLSSRETAQRVGLEQSQGAIRASGWACPPTVRPTNITVAPGSGGDFESLIADTKRGILIDGPRTFAIDGFGRTFTATAEAAWEIVDGKRGRLLKNPLYQGTTADFWRGCDVLAGEGDWSMYGSYGPAKGRPAQGVPMGAAASPGRFTRVEVGTHHRRPPSAAETSPLPLLKDDSSKSATGRTATGRKGRRAKKKTRRKVRKKDTK